jgi:hypothetical protein
MCKWLDKSIKKMKWYDISFVKMAVFFMTLFLFAVWPAFRDLVLQVEWFWYLGLGIVFTIPVMVKIFK